LLRIARTKRSPRARANTSDPPPSHNKATGRRCTIGVVRSMGVPVGVGDALGDPNGGGVNVGVGVSVGADVAIGTGLNVGAGVDVGVEVFGAGREEVVGLGVPAGESVAVAKSVEMGVAIASPPTTGTEAESPTKVTISAETQPRPLSAAANSICHHVPSAFRPTTGAVSPGHSVPSRG
jgi:hypothetical protein